MSLTKNDRAENISGCVITLIEYEGDAESMCKNVNNTNVSSTNDKHISEIFSKSGKTPPRKTWDNVFDNKKEEDEKRE